MKLTSTQFQIFYRHSNCPVQPGIKWQDQWSCACNGQCPACGTKDIEPYDYEEIEQTDTAHSA